MRDGRGGGARACPATIHPTGQECRPSRRAEASTAAFQYPPAEALALPNLKTGEEADLRDRLARVLFAANDFAGAATEFAAEAKLLGGESKLAKESIELWARSLYGQQKYADAAAMYAAA